MTDSCAVIRSLLEILDLYRYASTPRMAATDVGEPSGRRSRRSRPLSPEDNYLNINAGRESLNEYIKVIYFVTMKVMKGNIS